MAGRVKVCIGIPHIGDIPPAFFDTFLSLSRAADTPVVRVPNKPIDLARNMICEAALEDPDVTHVFFMDVDMQFPPDALFRLVQRDKDVVGGTYMARAGVPYPHTYTFHHADDLDGTCPLGADHKGTKGRWFRTQAKQLADFLRASNGFPDEPGAVLLPPTAGSLIEADALGAGCLLIKREVLEKVPRPWFRNHYGTAGGEDMYFCDRVKEAGFEIWGDWSVQCTHEFRYMWLDRADFMQRFQVGKEDEYDWDRDMIVDAAPQSVAPHIVEAR